MKKTLYIIEGIYPCVTGGLEIFYYHLLNNLFKKKEFEVLTPCKEFCKNNRNGVYISPRLFVFKKFGLGELSRYLQIFIYLSINKQKFNKIYYVHEEDNIFSDWFISIFQKLLHINYIIAIHKGISADKYFHNNRALKVCNNAQALIVPSKAMKKDFSRFIPNNKIEVILPLIPFYESNKPKSQIKQELKLNTTGIIILFLGTIKKLKNPDILLDAFIKLGKDFIKKHNIQLIYAGHLMHKNLKSQMDRKIYINNLTDFVKFYGQVPFDEINKFYEISDIYVIPSEYEGTPKSLLGAMYFKNAIIGSSVPGISQILSHRKTGLLFNPNDSDDLKKCLLEYINNEKLKVKMGESARKVYNERYDFEKIIEQHQILY
jgi:glycosyltransferase involved in cell wall biosynthesis